MICDHMYPHSCERCKPLPARLEPRRKEWAAMDRSGPLGSNISEIMCGSCGHVNPRAAMLCRNCQAKRNPPDYMLPAPKAVDKGNGNDNCCDPGIRIDVDGSGRVLPLPRQPSGQRSDERPGFLSLVRRALDLAATLLVIAAVIVCIAVGDMIVRAYLDLSRRTADAEAALIVLSRHNAAQDAILHQHGWTVETEGAGK